jgi:hypothetical protein
MRIYGPHATASAATSGASRRSGGATFTLPETPAASAGKATLAPQTAGGIETLLALQGIGGEDSAERRRRSVRRGRDALDALDDLKLSLLSGALDNGTVLRLKSAASDLKAASGDPGLDAVLAEIELRVEVELAKASRF